MSFAIRPLASHEIADAVRLLRVAASWSTRFGPPIWSDDELDHAGEEEQWFGGFEDGLAACMRIDRADRVHWPDDPPGLAIYVHKLAVARRAAGRGWPARLIAFSLELAASRRAAFVRLDTAPRGKLIDVYRKLGFTLVDRRPQMFSGRELVRLERAVDR